MIDLNANNRLKLIAQSSLGVVLACKFVNFQNHELLIRIIERMSRPRPISEPTCVATLAWHRGHVTSVAFHPSLPLLATGSGDQTAKVWRLSPDGTAASCVATLKYGSWVSSVAFHATEPLLATGSWDGTAKVWRLVDTKDGMSATCVATLAEHSSWVNSVAFHATEPLLATGSNDMTAKVWRLVDTEDGMAATCVATLAGHTRTVSSVSFHASEHVLATSSEDNTVKLWK